MTVPKDTRKLHSFGHRFPHTPLPTPSYSATGRPHRHSPSHTKLQGLLGMRGPQPSTPLPPPSDSGSSPSVRTTAPRSSSSPGPRLCLMLLQATLPALGLREAASLPSSASAPPPPAPLPQLVHCFSWAGRKPADPSSGAGCGCVALGYSPTIFGPQPRSEYLGSNAGSPAYYLHDRGQLASLCLVRKTQNC